MLGSTLSEILSLIIVSVLTSIYPPSNDVIYIHGMTELSMREFHSHSTSAKMIISFFDRDDHIKDIPSAIEINGYTMIFTASVKLTYNIYRNSYDLIFYLLSEQKHNYPSFSARVYGERPLTFWTFLPMFDKLTCLYRVETEWPVTPMEEAHVYKIAIYVVQ